MAHHAPRPSSERSASAGLTSIVPRPRWSRFTTALAALVGVAVVLTGSATAAHADPSVAEIERQIDADWNKLEPIIERHNATRADLAAKRKQANALAARIAPLERQVDAAMDKVSSLAVRAYKGENVSTVNAVLGGRSPSELVGQLEMLDRFAHDQQQDVRQVADLRDELARQKAPLDEMVAQLTRTEAQLAAKKKQINDEIDRLQKLRLKVYGNGGGGPLRPAPCPASYPRRRRRRGGQVRLRADRQAVRLGCRGSELVRLLRADAGRLGQGRCVAAAQRRPAEPGDQERQPGRPTCR